MKSITAEAVLDLQVICGTRKRVSIRRRLVFYDPGTGRFTTADAFLGDIGSPSSLHRYVYAYDNPTTYVDEDGRSATAVGAAVGLAWGVGQSIGRFIDDTIDGRQRAPADYLWTVVQNTAGGALIGASIDAAVLTGGTGIAVAGALGGAGSALITGAGEARGLSEVTDRVTSGAVAGAVGGVALAKVSPWLGVAARKATTWLTANVPGGAAAAELVTEAGRRVMNVAGRATTAVAARYEGGALGQKLAGTANPFMRGQLEFDFMRSQSFGHPLAVPSREVLRKPSVSTPGALKNIVDNQYKGVANPLRTGTGTTADAIRYRLDTGRNVRSTDHLKKGLVDDARGLIKWLDSNPAAPYQDRLVAMRLLQDLRDAAAPFKVIKLPTER